jgi:hypothetical protein
MIEQMKIDLLNSEKNNGELREEVMNLKKQLDTTSRELKNGKAAMKRLETRLPNWEYIQEQFSTSIRSFWEANRNIECNDVIVNLIGSLQKVNLIN